MEEIVFKISKVFILAFVFLISINTNAQHNFVLNGIVKDATTGDFLPGVSIFEESTKNGTTTNQKGEYSIKLKNGEHKLTFSFIGYERIAKTISIVKDSKLNIELRPSSQKLENVVINAKKSNENVSSTEVSIEKISIEQIEKIPIIMGETDIFKTIQMLPGINSVAEGRAGFIVRGGGLDQNLILMDEMPLYYASHQRGLYSVFNSAAVNEMTVYKGGIPARYGGRSSAVLDVRMTQGNFEKHKGKISLGLITSKFSLEAPILKDKLSVFIAGRGTRWGFGYWSDRISGNSVDDTKGKGGTSKGGTTSGLTFFQPQERWYDFNTKVVWKVNNKNRLSFSGYYGKDYAITLSGLTDWGNQAGHLKWNHIFNDDLVSNTSFIASKYSTFNDGGRYHFYSGIGTYSFKQNFTYYSSNEATWRFGLQSEYQDFNHGSLLDITQDDAGKFMPPMQGLESALYSEFEKTFKEKFAVHLGLRLSLYNRLGPGHTTVFDDESNEEISQKEFLGFTSIMATYINPEPRASATYIINKKNSIKASYNRNAQYLRLMTLGSDITWYDIWMPSTENISPMLADQFAIGYFRNFFDNKIELSAEAYYKYQNGVSDFEDGLHNYLVDNLEAYVAQGIGKSYGFEISIEKPKGDFTGRVSYNLGESLWEIDVVNQGRSYPNMFDITHSLNSQFSYNPSNVKGLKDLTFSINFVYYTGRPVTLPESYYYIGGVAFPYWEARNSYRLPDYHRLDIGIKYEPIFMAIRTKNKRNIQPSLDISLYNIYNRRNIFTMDIVNNSAGKNGANSSSLFSAYGRSTFGFVPSFQFNLKF